MQRIKTISKLMGSLLLLYLLLRVVFGFIYFRNENFSIREYLSIFYWGLRLDFAALFYCNVGFLFFYFFIAPFFSNVWQWRLSAALFSVINLPFVAINFIDLVYFRYTYRRSTIDILNILEDSIHSFRALFNLYWFVLLLYIIAAVFFVFLVVRILKTHKHRSDERWYMVWVAPIIFIGISFLVARGLKSRPIVPSSALLRVDPAAQPLVNNSTLNILYSTFRFSHKPERKSYFTPAVLDSIYPIRHEYAGLEFKKRNVVVFILESFDAGFFNPGPRRAYTPFLDSLMNLSTVCDNAFANGHESVKGIMAILGSIPPFLDEPIFISNYSAVPFKGIGTLLKEEGYSTSFFLGAEYDHFNFAKLCRMVGLDEYYSQDDYKHPEQDDGSWGIYDDFFFKYFAEIISQKTQPFFTVLFNLSSHPPFKIPEEQRAQLSIPGQSPQLNSITYVDHSFRKLFQNIKAQPWFSQTLFVFCADHTLLEDVYDRSRLYKGFHIPLFIYDPQQNEQETIRRTVQQLDLVPTILYKLGYSKPFMSFGKNIYSADSLSARYSIYKGNEGYQLTGDGMLTGFDDKSNTLLYHYNYLQDSMLTRNLADPGDSLIQSRVDIIKAIVQRFNNSLLDRGLMIEK
jgi:phosphoglycerol transferase MdoB-like AlkP superfamily enzyme